MNTKRKTSRTVKREVRMLAPLLPYQRAFIRMMNRQHKHVVMVGRIKGGQTHAMLSDVVCKAIEVPGQVVTMPHHSAKDVAALFRRYHFRAHARGNQVSGTIGRLGKWSFRVV